MLRVLAMLVRNVASTLPMIRRRPPVKATQAMPAGLPRVKTDTIKEQAAAPQSSPIALILSSAQSARPSKDEGVLTTLSHTSPSPSVSLTTSAIHLPLPSRWRQAHRRNEGDIASTAFGGGGGLRALARKTEGALSTRADHPKPRLPIAPSPLPQTPRV